MTLPRKSGYQVACSTHGVSFQDAARSLLTKKQSEVDPRSWQYVLEHPAMASLRTKLSTARSAGATSQRRAGSTQGQVQQPARSSGNKRPDTPSLHTQLTLEDARLQQDLAEELTLVIERVSSTSGSPKKKLQLGAHLRRLRDYFERSIDGARRQLLYQLHRDAYWHRVYVGSIADSPNPQGTQLLQLIVELQQQYLRTLREARTMEVGTPGSGQGSSPGSMSSLQKLEEVKKRVTIPRRRRNLKKESKATLRAWMFAHLKHPYPTEEEKVELARSVHTLLVVSRVGVPL